MSGIEAIKIIPKCTYKLGEKNPTLTCWYLNVKKAAGGRNPIIAHAITRILVLMGQLSAATHGEESLQESQPSAHGKHSKATRFLYMELSPWNRKEKKKPYKSA